MLPRPLLDEGLGSHPQHYIGMNSNDIGGVRIIYIHALSRCGSAHRWYVRCHDNIVLSTY
jgi:hypothetical protein